MLNDVHVYENCLDALKTQLERDVRPAPQLFFHRKPDSIYDYKFEDFNLINYNPHEKLPKGEVSEQGTPGQSLNIHELEEHPPFGDGYKG